MGEPVIFVHGSQGDYRTWLPMVERFAPNYRAIAYSRRYHYPNPWTGDGTDYTPSLHAEDLIAFIEALQLGPANVVANSFGAYTTLVAAIRRPDLIRKMVIGEPPILPWLKEIPGGQVYWDGFMNNAWLPATQAFQGGDLEQGVRLFVDGVSGKGDYDRLPGAVKTRFLENARELYDNDVRKFTNTAESRTALGFDLLTYVQSMEESKAIDEQDGPMVIISASGMLETGRVVHHVRHAIEDPRKMMHRTGCEDHSGFLYQAAIDSKYSYNYNKYCQFREQVRRYAVGQS